MTSEQVSRQVDQAFHSASRIKSINISLRDQYADAVAAAGLTEHVITHDIDTVFSGGQYGISDLAKELLLPAVTRY